MKTTFFFVALLVAALPVQAEICKVTDPTGTPLNVRLEPNGLVLGKLRNFTRVYIHFYDTDLKGRSWAYISWHGQPLKYRRDWRHEGYVFREFISCYR
ncbi:MAG: SH3 domain-containing protein [Neisseria sp.]|nr:SH3 domain-containing protein [Neisseria sp.]